MNDVARHLKLEINPFPYFNPWFDTAAIMK